MEYDTPVSQLIAASGQLSVHKRTAYHTITSMFKTIQSGLPKYNSDRMEESRPLNLADTRTSMRYRVDYNLSVSRGSYFYRGSRLMSLLPPDIFQARDLTTFKVQAKKWVKLNIHIYPP